MPQFKVSGLDEVLTLLDQAPTEIVLLGYGRAARAGINVMAAELVRRTPVKTGKLAKSLRVKVRVNVTRDATANGVWAAAGFTGSQAIVASALEYGHAQVTHAGETVGHVQAYPFIRPAFDASADAAIAAFAASLEETLK